MRTNVWDNIYRRREHSRIQGAGGNQNENKFHDFLRDDFALEIYKGLRAASQNLRAAEKAGNKEDITNWETEWEICNNALLKRGYNTAEISLGVQNMQRGNA
jgi:hypothetical protein